ncbi:MAG: tetratricopeptide repeat protein [Moraxellaceae bacterium]|nr:tetratricopeptide repeat protein [Moraxellaceae bacterium]
MNRLRIVMIALLAGAVSGAQAASPAAATSSVNVQDLLVGCPTMTHGYGPFDYRTASQDQKNLVEGAHFLPQVENLIRGHRSYLGGDIDYTLRAFPNHPRALMSMMRLFEREKMKIPQGARAPLRCYFEHGIRFREDDPMPRLLYGIHLLKIGQREQAISFLESAGELDDSNPNTQYNLGLAYLQLKRYDEALDYAHKAYGAGFPLPGLRNGLVKAGKWRDPAPEAASAPAESASAPAAVSAPAAQP